MFFPSCLGKSLGMYLGDVLGRRLLRKGHESQCRASVRRWSLTQRDWQRKTAAFGGS